MSALGDLGTGLGAAAPYLASGLGRGLAGGEQARLQERHRRTQEEALRQQRFMQWMELLQRAAEAQATAGYRQQQIDEGQKDRDLRERLAQAEQRAKTAEDLRKKLSDPEWLPRMQTTAPQVIEDAARRLYELTGESPVAPVTRGGPNAQPVDRAFGRTQVGALPNFPLPPDLAADIEYKRAGTGLRGAQTEAAQARAAYQTQQEQGLRLTNPVRARLLGSQADYYGALAGVIPKREERASREATVRERAVNATIRYQQGQLARLNRQEDRLAKHQQWLQGHQDALLSLRRLETISQNGIRAAQAQEIRQRVERLKDSFSEGTKQRLNALIPIGWKTLIRPRGTGQEQVLVGSFKSADLKKTGIEPGSAESPEGKKSIEARRKVAEILGLSMEALSSEVFIPNPPPSPNLPALAAPGQGGELFPPSPPGATPFAGPEGPDVDIGAWLESLGTAVGGLAPALGSAPVAPGPRTAPPPERAAATIPGPAPTAPAAEVYPKKPLGLSDDEVEAVRKLIQAGGFDERLAAAKRAKNARLQQQLVAARDYLKRAGALRRR